MGKKVKKKNNRASPRSSTVVEIADKGVAVALERRQCCHLDKCLDLNELSSKIGSSELISCEDCRECSADRRGSKGRAKHGKKKGGTSTDVKFDSKAIWICLQCGHYACGGIGLPTSSQSHAVRHVRQSRHPVVIQFENPHLRWCFSCNTLIPVEKTEEEADQKDSLSSVVKLIRGRLTAAGSPVDVENACLASSEVTIATKSESSITSDLDRRNYYVVKGLVNLGNTCFFNSILQNLLAMDMLSGYFLKLEECVGPLTIALKKLFIEARMEGRIKGSINPRSVFGCISSKAPQFKGYDQHDSHELLRVLLDGLSTEELALRKTTLYKEERISAKPTPTFVDEMFGGQISSTVCCKECGHTSTVNEPFLDLSLSVPTKKPLTKKVRPVSRAKKTKLPPKRSGRTLPKTNKAADVVSVQSASATSASSELSLPVEADSVGPTSISVEYTSDSQNVSDVQESEREVFVENGGEGVSDDTWLDFLGPDLSTENCSIPITLDFNNNDKVINNDDSSQSISESSTQVTSLHYEPNQKPDFSSVNSWDDESPLQVQASEVLLLPFKEDSSSAEGAKVEDQASSSILGCAQDDYDGFGFGDMFNEPEITIGPMPRPSVDGVMGSGFVAGNISESDPDEIDSTDSPVSVESCLAYFTKPELLSNENGYNCEKCSKRMLEAREKQSIAESRVLENGHQAEGAGDILCFNEEPLVEFRNQSNINLKNGSACHSSGESLMLHENIDCSSQNCTEPVNSHTGELNHIILHAEDAKVDVGGMDHRQSFSLDCNNISNQESSDDKTNHSFSIDEPSGSGLATTNTEPFAGNCKSEENKDVEKDSDSTIVTVKRDATKRFFIHKAPPILTIHIKRFSPDARGRYSKLNGHVSFKETIDLKPYMDTWCSDRDKCNYRLVGVVEHSGSMRGGHYVAYVRGGKRKSNGKSEKEEDASVWYYASDASVYEVSLDKVLHCEAYLLFYEIT